jgi:hypothetical protein
MRRGFVGVLLFLALVASMQACDLHSLLRGGSQCNLSDAAQGVSGLSGCHAATLPEAIAPRNPYCLFWSHGQPLPVPCDTAGYSMPKDGLCAGCGSLCLGYTHQADTRTSSSVATLW